MSNLLVDLSDSLAAAAEKAGQATVSVHARRRIPATGILYAKDLVLTADHVIEREENIRVTLASGASLPAKLAGRDPGTDLALLRLESPAAAAAEASKTPARVGQLALLLGRVGEEGLQASLGVISALGGQVRTPRGGLLESYIRTDAISYPGFSGGPTVAADGSVLGLNTSGFGGGAAITIPVGIAWQVAETLAKHGRIKRGYLGIRSQVVEIPQAQQDSLQRAQPTGLLILGIEKDSPAGKDGLLVGDILVALNGIPAGDHEALFAALGGDVAGKPAKLQVLRGGAPAVLDVAVGER